MPAAPPQCALQSRPARPQQGRVLGHAGCLGPPCTDHTPREAPAGPYRGCGTHRDGPPGAGLCHRRPGQARTAAALLLPGLAGGAPPHCDGGPRYPPGCEASKPQAEECTHQAGAALTLHRAGGQSSAWRGHSRLSVNRRSRPLLPCRFQHNEFVLGDPQVRCYTGGHLPAMRACAPAHPPARWRVGGGRPATQPAAAPSLILTAGCPSGTCAVTAPRPRLLRARHGPTTDSNFPPHSPAPAQARPWSPATAT